MEIKEAPANGREDVAATRRLINDSIAKGAASLDREGAMLFEFFCECGDLTCDEVVRLTVAQYRGIRSRPVVFHPRRTHDA